MVGILANQKGGVAKTTNTVHLAAALADKGKKTLIIDFDSQCDATHSVGIKDYDYSVVELLENKGGFKLKQKAPNFFVLPGSDDFVSNKYKKTALKEALHRDLGNGTSLYSFFDYIFIDCPPSKIIIEEKKHEYSEIELALMASDFFMIPLKADDFSVKNANKFLGKVSQFIQINNLNIDFLGFFFGCVLVTKNSKDHYSDIFRKHADELLLKTFIRQDSEVEKAVQKGKTIFQHKPGCRAANDYLALTKEFLKRIKVSNGKDKK